MGIWTAAAWLAAAALLLRLGIVLLVPWLPEGDGGLVFFGLWQAVLFCLLASASGLKLRDIQASGRSFWRAVTLSAVLGVGLKWPAEWLRSLIERFWPTPPAELAARAELLHVDGVLSGLALVLFAGLTGPFVEELLYRGPIFGRLRQQRGLWVAGVLTGAFFVFSHPSARDWPPLALVTFFLTLVRVFGGSLWHSIACHAAFNLVTCLSVVFGSGDALEALARSFPGAYAGGAFLLALLSALLLSCLSRISTQSAQ